MEKLPIVIGYGRIKSPVSYQAWLSGIPVVTVAIGGVETAARVALCEFKIDAKGAPVRPACNISRVMQKGMRVLMEIGVDDTASLVRNDLAGAGRAIWGFRRR